MDHTNYLKIKYPKVLFCYYFEPEKINGIPNKVELVEAVTELFIKYWEVIVQRDEYERSIVKTNLGQECDENMI